MRCRSFILVLAALAGCGGKSGGPGACKIVDEGGARTLLCPDGSRARLPASRTCTVAAVGEGARLECDDGSSVNLPTGGCSGEPGPAGGWILHCGDVDLVIPADTGAGEIAGTASLVGQSDGSGTMVTLEGTSFSATTDSTGRFAFEEVPAGVYALRFEHATFETVRFTNLVIEPGRREISVELRRSRLLLAGTPQPLAVSRDAAVFFSAGTAYLLRAQDPDPLPLERDGTVQFSPKGKYLYEGGKVLEVADPTHAVVSGDPTAFLETFSDDERFLAAVDGAGQVTDVYELATGVIRTFAGTSTLRFRGDTLLAFRDGGAVALRADDIGPSLLPCWPIDLEGSWGLCPSPVPTLIDLDSLSAVPIPGAEFVIEADPRGHSVAVWASGPLQRTLMVFEVGALDRAVSYDDVATFESFSPDARHFVYWDRAGERRVRDIRDGSSFGVPSGVSLSFAGDGSGLAYASGEDLIVEPFLGSTTDVGTFPGFTGFLVAAGDDWLLPNDGATVLLDRSLGLHTLGFAASRLLPVSPDGRTLMLSRRSELGLRAVDLVSFSEQDVPGAADGQFTGSGRRFVFTRPQDGQVALLVHDLDTGTERVLDTGWISAFYVIGDSVLLQRQSLSGDPGDVPDGLWWVSLAPP